MTVLPSASIRGRATRVAAAAALVLLASTGAAPGAAASSAPRAEGPPGGSRAAQPHAEVWWYDHMGLDRAHQEATGEGVTIAVLDDGLQQGVPALAGADIELMASPCLTGGGAGGRVAEWNSGAEAEHGTAMVSMILGGGEGPGGPGTGIRGSAPDAKVLFFDVDDEQAADADGLRCNTADKARTFDAAIDAGADIISVSNGGPPDTFIPDAVSAAVARNEAVIVAANNDESPFVRRASDGFITPSGVPGVLSVNALDRANAPWEYSLTLYNSSGRLDTDGWYAPAVSATGVDLDMPGGYAGAGADAEQTGTSAPTAMVAGVMALVKQRWPEATANQLVQHAIHYTSRFNDPGQAPDMEWQQGAGFGLVSAPNMLREDPTVWPDENPLLIAPDEVAEVYPTSLREQPAAEATPETASGAASGQDAPEAETDDQPQAATAAGEASAPSDDAGTSWWPWALAGAVVLLLAALLLARGRRRGETEPTQPDPARGATDDDNRPLRDADSTGV